MRVQARAVEEAAGDAAGVAQATARAAEEAVPVQAGKVADAADGEDRTPLPSWFPPKGKPNTRGYDSDGNRLAYANSRPRLPKALIKKVWENARAS